LLAIKQANCATGHSEVEVEIVPARSSGGLVKHDSTNPEAYQFYLRGRYFWNKRTSDGIKQAIEHFQQSIERDPEFCSWLRRPGGFLHWTDILQFCSAARAMPKAERIGNKGAGTG